MSIPATGPAIIQVNRTLLVSSLATNVADLHLVDLSVIDTILLDDTNGGATCVMTLPKCGSPFFPLGKRITIRKSSTVAFSVSVTPNAADAITKSAAAAYPNVEAIGVANTSSLPASVPNDVTFEATNLHVTTGAVNAAPGVPTLGGIVLRVAGSVASV